MGDLVARFLRGEAIDEVVNAYDFDTSGKPTSYPYRRDALQSVVGLSGHAGSVEGDTAVRGVRGASGTDEKDGLIASDHAPVFADLA
jgi:hypothetical protein